MSILSGLRVDFNDVVNMIGTQLRLRYFNTSIGSVWDDEGTLTQSGT